MMRMLQARSARERRLIGIAAVLLAAVGLVQFVYLPLADYRERERRAWDSAAERLARVETQAAEIVALRGLERAKPEAVAEADRSIRSIVGRSAKAAGLALSRLAPEPDGRLGVWFDAAAAPALFRWIEALETRHGITVAKATISADSDGSAVRAQLTLARAEPAS